MDGQKYLGFHVKNELFGIPLSKVREVHRCVEITPLHETTKYLKGVINLRGRIVPIVDMRLKLGIEEQNYNDRTIFIILNVTCEDKQDLFVGIAVDAVDDVVELSDEAIENTDNLGLRLKRGYLNGIAQTNGKMMLLLNPTKIFTTDDTLDDLRAVEQTIVKEQEIPAEQAIVKEQEIPVKQAIVKEQEMPVEQAIVEKTQDSMEKPNMQEDAVEKSVVVQQIEAVQQPDMQMA